MNAQDLKILIKESVREVIQEERLALCDALIPYIDPTEQAEIETEYGLPADYEDQELIDMTLPNQNVDLRCLKHGDQHPQ